MLSYLATREEIRTYQFITNNYDFFHLWGKENLLIHKEVSKHCEDDSRETSSLKSYFCAQNSLLSNIVLLRKLCMFSVKFCFFCIMVGESWCILFKISVAKSYRFLLWIEKHLPFLSNSLTVTDLLL